MKNNKIHKILPLLWLLVSCDHKNVEVGRGIDSDFEVAMFAFIEGTMVIDIEISSGRNIYRPESANWDEDEDFIRNLIAAGISNSDSIKFTKPDGSFQLVFINPVLDDSIDFNSKIKAHFWNIENWYGTDDAVYYLLTEEHFNEFGQSIPQ